MEAHIRTAQIFYNAEQNKKPIYYAVLGLWVFTLTLFHLLFSLFASSESKLGLYMTLIISMPLLYGVTHWLLICFNAQLPSKTTDSIYSVTSEHDLRTDL